MTGLRRFGPLLAVVALLLGAAVAATLATPQVHRAPLNINGPAITLPPPDRTAGAPTAPPQDDPTLREHTSSALPIWLTMAAQLLCLLVVGAGLGFLVWYLTTHLGRRHTDRADEPEESVAAPAREQVLAAVDAGLVELADDDADPRRAVIACWVRLEQAAAAAGTPREPGDTPAELVTRLLEAHRVSSGVLYALAEVYRIARYATHVVDAGMRDQARGALGQLRAELSMTPAVPTPAVPA
jgi:hypothetical protein